MKSFVLILFGSLLVLSSCGLNSEVTFKEPAPLSSPVIENSPGLGVSNGGYFNKTTNQGNRAALSLGAPTNLVSGPTAQGNKVQFNVIGQQAH